MRPGPEVDVRDETSPTSRALLTLELIQGSPGISADRLAEKLDVSERAARRYVGILREAGIPIESERGPYGGYRVGRGLRLPPLVFSAPEALGLVMAVLDGHHEAGDPTDPVGSALGKIVRALPEPVARQAEAVRRTTAPAPDHAAVRPDPGTTSTLVGACADRLVVRLSYRSEAGSEWDMEVEPWAVVVRHGRWYVLCRRRPGGEVRTFRVDRVLRVVVLSDQFTPPVDLEPVAMLEEHLSVGWEYLTDVVVDAPLDTVRAALPRGLGRLEPEGEDRTRLVGSTSNPVWYAEQLTRLPASFHVAEGPELREAVCVLGRRLLEAGHPVTGGQQAG
jgi:predicted DNA-binding transcriptional regulator YafY